VAKTAIAGQRRYVCFGASACGPCRKPSGIIGMYFAIE
jgi:hypothetical protein